MSRELSSAIQSLKGKTSDEPIDHYVYFAALHVDRAVEGYLYLREAGRLDASRHLIRTVIESVIRVQALQAKPEIFCQIAYGEFEEDQKLVRNSPIGRKAHAEAAIDAQWAEFKRRYTTKYPGRPVVEHGVSLRDAATAAGVEGFYDTQYRLYCRFTHAALRATSGSLNDLHFADNQTMTLCAFACIEALTKIGASSPNFEALRVKMPSSA
jgi:hypothetical protein